ncbi:hypothetical protein [Lactococcus garvieae]|uniref:hypothetical protein n=1 Tax=Lactococcus garvieae TaxID=1363 RepID=UPI00254E45AB|nr:hypothetical protein [Lactococcus garvieae]
MAKYGLNQFNRTFTQNPKKLFGTMTYLGNENIPEMVFVDENGEKFEEQNAEGTLKAVPTGEIAEKYIMIASPNFPKQIDIKVPVDFDETTIPFRSEIELVEPVTASVYKSNHEVVGRNGRVQTVPKITFPLKASGVKVATGSNSNVNTNAEPPRANSQEEQSKPKNK